MKEPEVELLLADVDQAVPFWSSYEFNSDYTTPTDGFSFTVEDHRLDPATESALVPGAAVQLRVADCVQATGYLDAIERGASRDGGVVWRLSGRDAMGQAVDTSVDPRFRIKPTESLQDVLVRLFSPFGWSDPTQIIGYSTTDIAEKTARMVEVRKQKSPPPERKNGERNIDFYLRQDHWLKNESSKSRLMSQLTSFKPNSNEGVFGFAARIAKRYRLQLNLSAGGRHILVDTPLFDQVPLYTLIRSRKNGSANNMIEANARFDATDQPTVIVADGFSGGGQFGRSKMRVLIPNPAMAGSDEELNRIQAEHRSAKVVSPWPDSDGFQPWTQYKNPRGKPLYLHDENSKTLEQLEAFARREMMGRVRKSLTYSVTVAGHGQYDEGGRFTPWAVNTVVDVQDEVAGVVEPMWIQSRTFSKSRSSGTTTRLELIRLHSLEL